MRETIIHLRSTAIVNILAHHCVHFIVNEISRNKNNEKLPETFDHGGDSTVEAMFGVIFLLLHQCLFVDEDDIEKTKGGIPTPAQLSAFKMAPVEFEKVRPFR